MVRRTRSTLYVFIFIQPSKLSSYLYLVDDAAINEIAQELDIRKSTAERLRQLRDFEIVIVCDDSGSMRTPVDGTQRTRWNELCDIVKIVIRIGTMFDSNGVDIHFLNRQSYLNVTDHKTVDEAFQKPPSGFTPLIPVLNRIFTSRLADRGRDKQLLVLVATDGVPTDNNGNEIIEELERAMRITRRVETTYVSFLLCTDEAICVNYMREWDKRMVNVDVTDDYHTEKKRIRECQRNPDFPFSYGDYVVKSLVGAIDPEMDALNEFS